jgi:hypothetical protein
VLSIRWPDLRPRGGVTPGDPRRAFRCTRDRVKPLVGARVEWCGLSAAFVSPDFSSVFVVGRAISYRALSDVRAFLRYGDVSYYHMLRARDAYDPYVAHGATWLPDRESFEPETLSDRSDRAHERKTFPSSGGLSGRS